MTKPCLARVTARAAAAPGKKMLLALFGIALGLLAGELTLRALGLPAVPGEKRLEHTGGLELYRSANTHYPLHRLATHSTYTHIYSSDPRGYFGPGNKITIAANNRGFRGPDFADPRSPGTFRIAFLGDSITLGEGVKYEDTYPALIAALLNAKPDRRATVVSYNYAMLAYNTTQEYLILLEEALSAQPDMIVLGYFLNDTEGPFAQDDPATGEVRVTGHNPFAAGVTDPPPRHFIFALRAARLAWQAYQKRRAAEQTVSYFNNLYGEGNAHLTENMESLRAIIELCDSRSIPLIVACLPVLYELDAGYPLAPIHRRIEEFVRNVPSSSTAFVDLLPGFLGKDARELWVHPTDHHPNERAHRIIAASLLPAIGRGLPAPPSRGGVPASSARETAP